MSSFLRNPFSIGFYLLEIAWILVIGRISESGKPFLRFSRGAPVNTKPASCFAHSRREIGIAFRIAVHKDAAIHRNRRGYDIRGKPRSVKTDFRARTCVSRARPFKEVYVLPNKRIAPPSKELTSSAETTSLPAIDSLAEEFGCVVHALTGNRNKLNTAIHKQKNFFIFSPE